MNSIADSPCPVKFNLLPGRTYHLSNLLAREHPEPDPFDNTPLPALPPPRSDIVRDARYREEWITPDGFYIAARYNPRPIIRDLDRRTVDLASLPADVRDRLIDDTEEAQFRDFGGPDYIAMQCGEPHNSKRAALWNAVIEQLPIDFRSMSTPEPPSNPILDLLAEREFDPELEPPPLRPIYSLAGVPISTPGNLTTITSAIKTGKSAVVGAMVASSMPHKDGADLLGFTSCNPDGFALLWFDSEQSPDDSWHCVNRAARRAGVVAFPPWVHAYCLTGLGSAQALECVQEAVKAAAEQHGGIHSIFIDGLADLVSDVNDAAESNGFVASLHDMAIQSDCPIVGVIHFNPGSEKSRGHLGSQVERKAETNLALEKDADESTVIYSTKNRRAGIPKNHGPRFKFSAEAGMHLTIESRQSARDADRREALLSLAEDAFGSHPAMRYSELQSTVKKLLSVSARTAERKVAEMKRLTVIKPSVAGLYVIATPAESK